MSVRPLNSSAVPLVVALIFFLVGTSVFALQIVTWVEYDIWVSRPLSSLFLDRHQVFVQLSQHIRILNGPLQRGLFNYPVGLLPVHLPPWLQWPLDRTPMSLAFLGIAALLAWPVQKR